MKKKKMKKIIETLRNQVDSLSEEVSTNDEQKEVLRTRVENLTKEGKMLSYLISHEWTYLRNAFADNLSKDNTN